MATITESGVRNWWEASAENRSKARVDRSKLSINRLKAATTGDNSAGAFSPLTSVDQIIAAVRAKGGSAWHVLAKNEGHVFRKKENVDYYFWESVMFWRQTLLGDINREGAPCSFCASNGSAPGLDGAPGSLLASARLRPGPA